MRWNFCIGTISTNNCGKFCLLRRCNELLPRNALYQSSDFSLRFRNLRIRLCCKVFGVENIVHCLTYQSQFINVRSSRNLFDLAHVNEKLSEDFLMRDARLLCVTFFIKPIFMRNGMTHGKAIVIMRRRGV